MTLGHVLRASDWEAIQAQSEINGANGLALCSWTESFLQYTPMGTYWPWSCPTEESIEQSKWNRPRNGKFLLEDSGAIKQAVRDTGAKIQVMIEYSNGLAKWPPWPISQLSEVKYTYKVHMVARDEEKTKVTDRVSRTAWQPRYNPHAATCGRCMERVAGGVSGDGSCENRNPIGNITHPGPGCLEYVLNETMNERHGTYASP
jgi:hypothetical protein|eukprot:COSAG06_NODE_658_length_13322_cov_3.396430_17_plen_203_part_00